MSGDQRAAKRPWASGSDADADAPTHAGGQAGTVGSTDAKTTPAPRPKKARRSRLAEVIALAESSGGVDWGMGRSSRGARRRHAQVQDESRALAAVLEETAPRQAVSEAARKPRKPQRSTASPPAQTPAASKQASKASSPRASPTSDVAPLSREPGSPALPDHPNSAGEHAWAEAAPGTSDVAGLVEESESDDGEQPKMAEWVQCESCRVWRLLPAHVRPSDLPVTWVCREATWRRLRCSEDMDGPEAMVNSDESRAVSPAGKGLREVSFPPAAAEPKLPVEEQEWVQCENCNKWRRLPPSVKASSLPEHWFCSQGQSWLPGLTCRLPEDESLWKVSAPAGSADGAHAAASSHAVSAGDRPGSSPDPQSPPERSLADAAAAAAIEASAPISFAAGTEAARAAVGTGPSGRGHPGAGSMAARTRSSGGAGGGSAIGTSISGAGAATAHASDSGESVPALPHWAHPLRPMSGYPGAPQPWRSISGLRASQQSHALVAVGLGFAPPTRKADCLESQEPGPSWTDIVFPNGSKPRYGGALAHGRGTAAALSHSCFVSSTAYVPEAVDVAVWGGMQRRLDQQERDAGARGMRVRQAIAGPLARMCPWARVPLAESEASEGDDAPVVGVPKDAGQAPPGGSCGGGGGASSDESVSGAALSLARRAQQPDTVADLLDRAVACAAIEGGQPVSVERVGLAAAAMVAASDFCSRQHQPAKPVASNDSVHRPGKAATDADASCAAAPACASGLAPSFLWARDAVEAALQPEALLGLVRSVGASGRPPPPVGAEGAASPSGDTVSIREVGRALARRLRERAAAEFGECLSVEAAETQARAGQQLGAADEAGATGAWGMSMSAIAAAEACAAVLVAEGRLAIEHPATHRLRMRGVRGELCLEASSFQGLRHGNLLAPEGEDPTSSCAAQLAPWGLSPACFVRVAGADLRAPVPLPPRLSKPWKRDAAKSALASALAGLIPGTRLPIAT